MKRADDRHKVTPASNVSVLQKLIQQYMPHFHPYYMSHTLKGIEHRTKEEV
jgi:20S proteasome alpha/beta subunit